MVAKGAKMNTSFLRERNTHTIMRCIKTHGPLSRVDICEKTSLSKPTVTRVINQLIQDGLLEEANITETVRGRHPVNIDFRPDAAYCFGVNISKNHLRVALINLKLQIVDKLRFSIKELSSSQELMDLIVSHILDMQQRNDIPSQKVQGIGVGAPGLVDSATGVIKDFALWGKMRDVPMAAYLEQQTGFKTRVDNNCNTWLMGELWIGYAQDHDDALFVLNSEGVGCGIARSGQVLTEVNSISAGLGHTSVNLKGERCNCGGQGCVETYCGTDHIERKAAEKLAAMRRIHPDESYAAPLTFRDICEDVEQGRMLFSDILLEAASAMACGIVNLINVLYPQIIILSGSLFDASDFYYNNVVVEVANRLSAGVELPTIVRRYIDDAQFEIGAATMILQELF